MKTAFKVVGVVVAGIIVIPILVAVMLCWATAVFKYLGLFPKF